MARVRGKYGAIPSNPFKPRVTLRAKPEITLTPPPSVDFYSTIPVTSWGMLANGPDNTIPNLPKFEGCGNCTIAGIAHLCIQTAFLGQGETASPITSLECLDLYEQLTGYDPTSGDNDTGLELIDVLKYWTASGFESYTPTAYMQVDITNLPLLKQCIADFGALYTGFSMWEQAEINYDNKQSWDLPTTRSGGKILGGHCVPIMGYSDKQKLFFLNTWGSITGVTYQAFQKYWGTAQGGEAWVAVLPQEVTSTGSTFENLDVTTANTDWQEFSGTTVSPFPSPTPIPPAPGPTPPGPDTNPADVALAVAAHTWLTAKGF